MQFQKKDSKVQLSSTLDEEGLKLSRRGKLSLFYIPGRGISPKSHASYWQARGTPKVEFPGMFSKFGMLGVKAGDMCMGDLTGLRVD